MAKQLSETGFAEFCQQGDALMRTAQRKQKIEDPVATKVAQLERQVKRLEARK
jgi:hypothetical protein